MMRWTTKVAILAASLPSLAMAQGQGRVMKLLRETISLYNADGTFYQKEERWPLPRDGEPVIGKNAAGQIGIKHGDRDVYLRNSEIMTAGVVDQSCLTASAASRPAGQRVAASAGIGSGMSDKAAPCIPPQ